MPNVKEFQLNPMDGSVLYEYDDGTTFKGFLDVVANGGTGPAGANGKTVLSGAAVPSAGLGTDGDFYIRTGVFTIQGPKAAGAWPGAVSLIGPIGSTGAAGTNGTNGTNGLDGKTVLSGTVAPGAGLGTNGDFYIRTDLLTIQGPRAAGAWPGAVSLVGPQGTAGSQGIQGVQGVQGPAGTPGTTIAVSTTAPVSPVLNQLWLDIN